jgi:hypothetical protein
MKATWLHPGISTVASTARARRRLDHQRRAVGRALDAMRRGATMHLAYGGREWWTLSTGQTVPREVAVVLIARPDIQAVGDTLFASTKSQTWRYLDLHKGD